MWSVGARWEGSVQPDVVQGRGISLDSTGKSSGAFAVGGYELPCLVFGGNMIYSANECQVCSVLR
jgi:hypothetical protein